VTFSFFIIGGGNAADDHDALDTELTFRWAQTELSFKVFGNRKNENSIGE